MADYVMNVLILNQEINFVVEHHLFCNFFLNLLDKKVRNNQSENMFIFLPL